MKKNYKPLAIISPFLFFLSLNCPALAFTGNMAEGTEKKIIASIWENEEGEQHEDSAPLTEDDDISEEEVDRMFDEAEAVENESGEYDYADSTDNSQFYEESEMEFTDSESDHNSDQYEEDEGIVYLEEGEASVEGDQVEEEYGITEVNPAQEETYHPELENQESEE